MLDNTLGEYAEFEEIEALRIEFSSEEVASVDKMVSSFLLQLLDEVAVVRGYLYMSGAGD